MKRVYAAARIVRAVQAGRPQMHVAKEFVPTFIRGHCYPFFTGKHHDGSSYRTDSSACFSRRVSVSEAAWRHCARQGMEFRWLVGQTDQFHHSILRSSRVN